MNTEVAINSLYYRLKPLVPRSLQIVLRRLVVKAKRKKHAGTWPILHSAGRPPENWPGWPEQKRMAVVLTHDVESRQGTTKCRRLAELETRLGFKSSFNFAARRYHVPDVLREELENAGFEIGVHGVHHDGKLFESKKIFRQRATIINQTLKEWKAVGFRSPAMHHNLEWLHELDISYDLSTFDTDPFEPQSDGFATIFPFWVHHNASGNRYLEMPYTLVQDFTLFILMKERTTRIWREKLDWIFSKGGMVLLNAHPDYMAFDGEKNNVETYPVALYLDFLEYLQSNYDGLYWHALPKEMLRFCHVSSALVEAA
jgi:peptidoglycan/xylan/chitin deacetylase (PgdA/CDA1 family)